MEERIEGVCGNGDEGPGEEAGRWGKQLLFAVVCLWNASSAGLLPAICARLRSLCDVVSQRVPTQLLPCTSPSLTGWPGAGEERALGLGLALVSSALAIAHVEAGLQGMLLLSALAGPAGDLDDALRSLLFRCLGCYAADCVRPNLITRL